MAALMEAEGRLGGTSQQVSGTPRVTVGSRGRGQMDPGPQTVTPDTGQGASFPAPPRLVEDPSKGREKATRNRTRFYFAVLFNTGTALQSSARPAAQQG